MHVNNERAHSKICHPNLTTITLVNKRHSRDLVNIPREFACYRLEKSPIKVVDDLQVSR